MQNWELVVIEIYFNDTSEATLEIEVNDSVTKLNGKLT
jgi:hypothetical protein